MFPFIFIFTAALLAAPTPPPAIQIEGAGNLYLGGEDGPAPASVQYVGLAVTNHATSDSTLRVLRAEIVELEPTNPSHLAGPRKITSVSAEHIGADGSPDGQARKADPLTLAPGDSAHLDVELEPFGVGRTAGALSARIWLSIDGRTAAVTVPLKVTFRIKLPDEQ